MSWRTVQTFRAGGLGKVFLSGLDTKNLCSRKGWIKIFDGKNTAAKTYFARPLPCGVRSTGGEEMGWAQLLWPLLSTCLLLTLLFLSLIHVNNFFTSFITFPLIFVILYISIYFTGQFSTELLVANNLTPPPPQPQPPPASAELLCVLRMLWIINKIPSLWNKQTQIIFSLWSW